jgi:hypothetical protein
MLALGLILNIVGIGLFCWLVFILAVYALPFFVGLGTGLAAFHAGAGITGTLLAGVAAAVVTIAFARTSLAIAPSGILRAAIAATFVVPAGIAGYHLVFGVSQLAVPSLLWREIIALFGATFVAMTAWMRISAFTDPHPIEPGGALGNKPHSVLRGPRARHHPSPHRR